MVETSLEPRMSRNFGHEAHDAFLLSFFFAIVVANPFVIFVARVFVIFVARVFVIFVATARAAPTRAPAASPGAQESRRQ